MSNLSGSPQKPKFKAHTKSKGHSKPRVILQHNPVPVWIFIRSPVPVPVRIERSHRLITCCCHSVDCGQPLQLIRNIKYEQAIFSWGTSIFVFTARELKVIRRTWHTEHHASESIVVFKRAEHD